jgi:hypothetical protein
MARYSSSLRGNGGVRGSDAFGVCGGRGPASLATICVAAALATVLESSASAVAAPFAASGASAASGVNAVMRKATGLPGATDE